MDFDPNFEFHPKIIILAQKSNFEIESYDTTRITRLQYEMAHLHFENFGPNLDSSPLLTRSTSKSAQRAHSSAHCYTQKNEDVRVLVRKNIFENASNLEVPKASKLVWFKSLNQNRLCVYLINFIGL